MNPSVKILIAFIMPDDSEDICAVCFDGGWTESNQIVYCDGCDVAVHQKVSWTDGNDFNFRQRLTCRDTP